MKTPQSTVLQYLASYLEVNLFDDICKNGLQVEGTRPISVIATAVSPSLFAIEEAIKKGADLLLTHHALFLKNGGVTLSGNLSKRVRALYGADMHLFSYHLPLDAHKECGNAWPVLKELGFKSLEPFGKIQGKQIGVKGMCNPISKNELLVKLQAYFGVEGVSFGSKKDPIQSVAFISGGGHRFLGEALEERVDCFITGTADESMWSCAEEENICVMAFGHYETEKRGVQLLGDRLAQEFKCKHFFIYEKNPF